MLYHFKPRIIVREKQILCKHNFMFFVKKVLLKVLSNCFFIIAVRKSISHFFTPGIQSVCLFGSC